MCNHDVERALSDFNASQPTSTTIEFRYIVTTNNRLQIKALCRECFKEIKTVSHALFLHNKPDNITKDEYIKTTIQELNREKLEDAREKLFNSEEHHLEFEERKKEKLYYQEHYHDIYLKTEYWKEIRCSIMKRDNFKCQDCQQQAQIVHHINYIGFPFKESEKSLISLCKSCHSIWHLQEHFTQLNLNINNAEREVQDMKRCKDKIIELLHDMSIDIEPH